MQWTLSSRPRSQSRSNRSSDSSVASCGASPLCLEWVLRANIRSAPTCGKPDLSPSVVAIGDTMITSDPTDRVCTSVVSAAEMRARQLAARRVTNPAAKGRRPGYGQRAAMCCLTSQRGRGPGRAVVPRRTFSTERGRSGKRALHRPSVEVDPLVELRQLLAGDRFGTDQDYPVHPIGAWRRRE